MSITAPSIVCRFSAPARTLAVSRQCPRYSDLRKESPRERRAGLYTYHSFSHSGTQRSRKDSTHVQHRSFHSSSPKLAVKDPYGALGIGKSASASEIKKAYYGLAKKYHPDTNKDPSAKEKFAAAQSAYEILSDPKKKEAFDSYGSAAFDQSGGFNPGAGGDPFGGAGGFRGGFGGGFGGAQGFGGADFNFEDLFGAFAGRSGRGRGQRAGGFAEEILVGDNIEVQTNITFMDAAKGVRKDVHITPLVQCKTCTGSGLKKGASRSACSSCDGTGTRVHFMQGGFQMASTCGTCAGTGTVTPRGSECGSCKGDGAVRERRTVTVDIPGGVEDGMRLRVAGEGDAAPTGQAGARARSQTGDLYVFIRVAPDSKFSRAGSDILYTASIPLTTAILGGEITVPTLDKDVRVRVGTGTNTGDRVTLSGMGMKKLSSRRGGQGDLRVEFKVQMPKYLSTNQRTIVEMLADEMGDKSAKRIMNVGKPPPSSTASSDTTSEADKHKNEGFLKSAWHRLTHQHDHLHEQAKPADQNNQSEQDEQKKKASGSS
ncbi:DnaJ C terminal domain-containing protein 1 [Elsinoe fawcettii]|nr:DnaJ C terminal domain-containing protein 1 [Elsinoe fawcettii]